MYVDAFKHQRGTYRQQNPIVYYHQQVFTLQLAILQSVSSLRMIPEMLTKVSDPTDTLLVRTCIVWKVGKKIVLTLLLVSLGVFSYAAFRYVHVIASMSCAFDIFHEKMGVS